MAKAVQMLQWDQTSLLAYLIANANRDPKARPKPYTIADFHPLRTEEEFETEESAEPDWGMIGNIRRNYKVSKLNGDRLQDDQRGGRVL
jgi:hypothetical protein